MTQRPPPLTDFPLFSNLDDHLKYKVMLIACRQDPLHASRLSRVDRHTKECVDSFEKIDGFVFEVSRDKDAVPFLEMHSDQRLGRMIRRAKQGADFKPRDRRFHFKSVVFFHPTARYFVEHGEYKELSGHQLDQLQNSSSLSQDVFLELVATLSKHHLESLSIVQLHSRNDDVTDFLLSHSWFISSSVWTCLGNSGLGGGMTSLFDCVAVPSPDVAGADFSPIGLNNLTITGATQMLTHEASEVDFDAAHGLPPAFQSLETLRWTESRPSCAYRTLMRVLPYCTSLQSLTIGLHTLREDGFGDIRPTPAYCLVEQLTSLDISTLPVGGGSDPPAGLFRLIPPLKSLEELKIKPHHLSKFFRSQSRHRREIEEAEDEPSEREPFSVGFKLKRLILYSVYTQESVVVLQSERVAFTHALSVMVPFKLDPNGSATIEFLKSLSIDSTNFSPVGVFIVTHKVPRADWWESTRPYLHCVHQWYKTHYEAFKSAHKQAIRNVRLSGVALDFCWFYVRFPGPVEGISFFQSDGSEVGDMAYEYLTSKPRVKTTFRQLEIGHLEFDLHRHPWEEAELFLDSLNRPSSQ